MLLALFVIWLLVAQKIYISHFGENPPASLGTGVSVDIVAVGRKGVNLLATQAIAIDLVN